ncbi:PucR family transcriptional regulator [Umezawaea endophytica]|uniref:Helix-turn-helix domain-containing protein n=1 Tax=Umezawaea endophytica TaxID=1654476 RepID=A0A9X2VGI7_9PSEU|nr:PucR family transcriptional regulator [Umezawaea endophytica]MCS7475719.1 helix-turn-helix domain-containing protein [Umezawaea endophytica]
MPSVRDLVTRLGPELITAPVGPSDLAVEFTSVVVHDPLDVPAFESGDLVLAVGVAAASPLALRLAAAGPAALLLRHDGPLGQALLAEALSAGVALLVVPSGCNWSHLHSIAASLPGRMPPVRADSVSGSELISDLFVVANALADALCAPVTIEDNQSRLLAYSALHEVADVARSATILGHRVPDAFLKQVRRLGVVKRLLTETEPFFLVSTTPGISSRTVVPLRAHGELLGSIWAVTDTPLDAPRTAALAEAAQNIAVRLAHHRLTTDLQHQHQTATMGLLLRGGESAVETGHRLGMTGPGYRLAAVTATRADGRRDDRLLDQCATALVRQLSLARAVGATARIEDTVYGVVPGPADPVVSLRELRGLLLSARTAARPDSPDLVTIGMSGPVSTLADLNEAKEEADQVVRVLCGARSHDGCAEVGEVGLAVSVLRLADLESARRAGQRSVLDDIDDHDVAHAADYGRTLRVYLSSFGDPTVASKALNVHTNTLRYRLRRLHEIFGLDLTDADTRFALMVDIRLKAHPPDRG